MAVRIRLTRRGRKKLALYDVIVADARAPRDGKFIEKIGTYNPLTNPATIDIDNQKAFDWLMKGALPTETVNKMLSHRGINLRRHLQIGVIKGAITQEQADAKLAEWQTAKDAKTSTKVDSLSKAKEQAAKARKEAETKVREAKAEAIRKKAEALNAPPAPVEVAEVEVAPVAEESAEA
jgi:small subunit ribosomal protein S16